MRNAATPITGGMSCPPVEAQVSTAPANSLEYPVLIIIGMVMLPVVTTFAAIEPEMVPMQPLAMTAVCAGPDRKRLPIPLEIFIKKSIPPEASKRHPKRTNINTSIAPELEREP